MSPWVKSDEQGLFVIPGCPDSELRLQASGQGERGGFSTGGPRVSPLGRIGYMGRRNPDLDPR